MQFSTNVPIKQSETKITYDSDIFSLGSCFAVNIDEKFTQYKFRSEVNPHGILFHPLSIEKFIRRAVNLETFRESDLVFNDERWHCFDAHSELSNPSKEQLLNSLNTGLQHANSSIRRASHVIITLGTAFIYKLQSSGEAVANCHKFPQKIFSKELTSVREIAESLSRSISILRGINPTAQIIFTISPVRHLKDGFVQNQNSKANLISALHEVLVANDQLDYFPSYEIVMDQLRDYRFYQADMIHPNQIAIDYIWGQFADAYLSDQAKQTAKIVDEIVKGKIHRAFNPDSDAHRKFLQSIQKKVDALVLCHPHIKF